MSDRRERLVALRDKLTSAVETSPVAYVAALARQLQSVLAELDSMPDAKEKSTSDDLAARRAARRAAAKAAASSADGGVKRGKRSG